MRALIDNHAANGGDVETTASGVRVVNVHGTTLLAKGRAGMTVSGEGTIHDFATESAGSLASGRDAIALMLEAYDRNFRVPHVLSPDSMALLERVTRNTGVTLEQ